MLQITTHSSERSASVKTEPVSSAGVTNTLTCAQGLREIKSSLVLLSPPFPGTLRLDSRGTEEKAGARGI